jgi:hypothetical protein
MVSGRVDAILKRGETRRVLEIKSTNLRGWTEFASQRGEKWEAAVAQLELYLWALNIEAGYLLIVNRDSCQLKEFLVTRDEPAILSLLLQLKRLKGHFENKTLPDPEYSKCTFCGYASTEWCPTKNKSEWLDQ